MNEQELLSHLNKKLKWELESTNGDQYCTYDAANLLYRVELKCRRKHYDTQMIERSKVRSNTRDNKDFLYVVSTPEGIYGFNISKLVERDYDFGWETRRLPATTDFNRNEWIDKEVGYIHVDAASYTEDL